VGRVAVRRLAHWRLGVHVVMRDSMRSAGERFLAHRGLRPVDEPQGSHLAAHQCVGETVGRVRDRQLAHGRPQSHEIMDYQPVRRPGAHLRAHTGSAPRCPARPDRRPARRPAHRPARCRCRCTPSLSPPPPSTPPRPPLNPPLPSPPFTLAARGPLWRVPRRVPDAPRSWDHGPRDAPVDCSFWHLATRHIGADTRAARGLLAPRDAPHWR
jgi:hypothetical protein